ncbi:uncharacterized protein RCC_03215 [Ramularia collo-cygni]|uniref:Membrane-associated proteins in eicosanoid and glutathione metabolism n=1 Tax=Ramularia collo-cygni TaxID=112498 RepID=A0A2D3UPN4_9PEZI|nr:uncharacterized protein RCC_03215 [Ramularia collo-cygni]CZT17381.1 uncharacterized protein RCC_03215 [Ramularia collo-cygni]
MIPITSTFALPLTLYYTLLQVRVISARISSKQSLAQSSPQPAIKGDDNGSESPSDPLLTATRCQSNFSENVPLALLLAGFVEANGGNRKALITALGMLTVARVMHVEMGLMVEGGKHPHTGIGRPVGFFGTVGVVVGLAGYGAWLGRGVWGF